MSRIFTIGICGAVLLIARSALSPSSSLAPTTQKLTTREDASHIVLAWSGPIAKPMRDELAAALEKAKANPRRLVIALNSPGGSIAHGHEVIATIRDAAYSRPIETVVEKGGVCASMCVPIYLQGARRTADPGALFMFHEASLNMSEQRKGAKGAAPLGPSERKLIETIATDLLYDKDIGQQRLNPRWARDMRAKIADREIWLTAQQLTDTGSGVIDALVPTQAR